MSNRFLPGASGHSHAVEQRVEWLYAFDVHCNAFFPSLRHTVLPAARPLPDLALNRVRPPAALPRSLRRASELLSLLRGVVGFNALPFLDNTVLFLYPVAADPAATPVLLLLGFNPTRFVLSIYFSAHT